MFLQVIQVQQKNMMEQVGQLLQVWQQLEDLGGAGTQALALAFGGNTWSLLQSATEEWTGAGPLTVTITAS
jgi:hypothetical protein